MNGDVLVKGVAYPELVCSQTFKEIKRIFINWRHFLVES